VKLDIQTIAKRLGAEDGKASSITSPVFGFTGFGSIFAKQDDNSVTLALVNDANSPGNTYFYGTGTGGVKGWVSVASALAESSNVSLVTGADGVTTFDLTDVTVTAGGTLKKRTFDAKGRLSQESAATTDDLGEGASNLYFTSARVLATTLTGLSTSTSAAVTASDSVLVGVGKLQAQVNTNATAIAGKEPAIASGTTSQYWRGDKTWRDFATDVRTAVLTGLSTATSAVIAATDTVLGALGKLQAQITDNLLPAGYIDGLQMQWVSGTALTVSSGAAYIQGSGKALRATSAIAKTGLSLTASTWYHVYLYNNAGTPDIEIVTTAPATSYSGTARSKSGDTSRRYLGSVLTNSSGGLLNFAHSNGEINYVEKLVGGGVIYRILTFGASISPTSFSASAVVPVSAHIVKARFQNNDASVYCFIANGDYAMAAGSDGQLSIPPSTSLFVSFACSSTQNMKYQYLSTPSNGLNVDVMGYGFER
jgi:hypothetical protein